MKLSEIVASLNELKQTVAGFIGDKSKATSEALGSFSAKLSTLETGAVAELNQKSADLTTAQQSVTSLTARAEKSETAFTGIESALTTACADFKLEIKPGASALDMVAALKDSVSTTLAKLNVTSSNIPVAKPATQPVGDEKTKTRATFSQLTPAAQLAFCKGGGKITD